jgi:hypothetical protein
MVLTAWRNGIEDGAEEPPTALDDPCRAAVGSLLSTEHLEGMSGAGVHRVRGTQGTVVVKSGVRGRELGVYTRRPDRDTRRMLAFGGIPVSVPAE